MSTEAPRRFRDPSFAAMLTLNLNYASLTTVPQSRTLRAAGCPQASGGAPLRGLVLLDAAAAGPAPAGAVRGDADAEPQLRLPHHRASVTNTANSGVPAAITIV